MLAVNVEFTFVDELVGRGAFLFPFFANADSCAECGFFGGVLVGVVAVFAEWL